MYDERLAEFSRERLDGRPIPDDLRVLLVAQWEGRTDLAHLLDLDFFEPGEVHPLLDTSHLSEQARADPETQAIHAAFVQMARYAKLVAKGGKGWLGYWLHPDDDPADGAWPLLELDTEGTFWNLTGRTLSEGAAAEQAGYQHEPDKRIAFTRLATELADHGLPLSTRDYDALDSIGYAVDPGELMEDLLEPERETHALD